MKSKWRASPPALGTDDWWADRNGNQKSAADAAQPPAAEAATDGGGARAVVRVQMVARREKQERERAVREEELAWLQEFDGRSTEYQQLKEKSSALRLTIERDCCGRPRDIWSQQMDQVSQR